MKQADNALAKWEELNLDYEGENKYASFLLEFFRKFTKIRGLRLTNACFFAFPLKNLEKYR